MYDTFSGMTDPSQEDMDSHGTQASDYMRAFHGRWCDSPLEGVGRNMESAYPMERIVFVPGKVEETIPLTLPKSIAKLRVDTDWYESTAHELQHLWPLVEPGGILIVDDYGDWQGARKAVDQYFHGKLFLARIDHTGRLAIKPQPT